MVRSMRRPSIVWRRSRSNSSAGKEACCASSATSFSSSDGELREPVKSDGAGVGAGARADVGAHAPQIFLDLAAGPRFGARANHGRGDLRQAWRFRGDVGVAAADIKFAGEFGNGVRFDQHDLEAVGELAVGARRPDDGAFGSKLRIR